MHSEGRGREGGMNEKTVNIHIYVYLIFYIVSFLAYGACLEANYHHGVSYKGTIFLFSWFASIMEEKC